MLDKPTQRRVRRGRVWDAVFGRGVANGPVLQPCAGAHRLKKLRLDGGEDEERVVRRAERIAGKVAVPL